MTTTMSTTYNNADDYQEFAIMETVCSKYLANTRTFNTDDCDEGFHPVELDPQRKTVEPKPVSTEETTSSFRCERCIDKDMKI
jgi:hypothetical protein